MQRTIMTVAAAVAVLSAILLIGGSFASTNAETKTASSNSTMHHDHSNADLVGDGKSIRIFVPEDAWRKILEPHAPEEPEVPSNAAEMYAKINGIEGEVHAEGHHGEIALVNIRFNVAESTSIGGSPVPGRLSDVTIIKYVDASSPALMTKAAKHEKLGDVELAVRKPGSTSDSVKIVLGNAEIVSYNLNTEEGDPWLGQYPYETIALRYSQIWMKYQPMDHHNSPSGKEIVKGWDISTSRET